MKKISIRRIAAALTLIVWVSGCSLFTHTPRHARIQIKGPGNHTNEFIISLDDKPEFDRDIALSDRYALELFLQWLWYEPEDMQNINTDTEKPVDDYSFMQPWFICKYRF